MAATEIGAGTILGEGRYALKRRLGAGGMATVWLAHDERLTRAVAVKVIADTLAGDARYRGRFAREARAAASVSHPSIVPVYDYGLHGDRPFLVMEHVPGGTLADALAAPGGVVPDPVAVATRLLSALECVHRAGLVHRDIKPANILLDAAGHPRLTDFGIAQPEDATSLTQTGMVIGTLRYLAPEVAAGAQAGPGADLYAAGMVLRELTERRPAPQLTALVTALTAPAAADRPASAAAASDLLGRASGAAGGTEPTRVAPSRTVAQAPRSTAATAVAQHAAATTPMMAAAARLRDVSPRLAIGAAVALVLVLVLVVSLAGGGGSSSARDATGPPAPAAPDAPLTDQLRSLQREVDHAAKPR